MRSHSMRAPAKLAALFVTGTLCLAGAAQAFAASVLTDAFVANVRPNVDFLDRSSRLALDNSASAKVRAFAHAEAIEQTVVANSLVAWTQTATVPGAIDAVGRPVDPIIAAPLETAVAATQAAGDVVTGRSVAEDRPLTVTRAPRDTLLPAGADDLARLSALKGRAFDALYRTTQRSALTQLSTVYADYIRNGEDPALRAMAVRELPKINRNLAELRRL